MIRIDSKFYILFIPTFIFAILFPIMFKNPIYLDIYIMFCLLAGLGGAWNIIGGYGGQFSIGHAGFFGIGAYTSTLLYMNYGLSPWLGALIGGGLSAFISILVFYPCFKLRGVFFTMASLAFGEIMMILGAYWTSLTRGNVGLVIPFKSGLVQMMFVEKASYAYLSVFYLVIVIGVSALVERAKLGSHLQGIRENEDAAESLGVQSAKCKSYAMMISAFLTAFGGTIYAQYTQFIDPETLFEVSISVRFALLSIIGGVGSILGPVIGSAILTPLDTMLRSLLGGAYSGLGFFTYGVILIVCVLALPEGVIRWAKDHFLPFIEKLPDFAWGEHQKKVLPVISLVRPTQESKKTEREPLLEIVGATKIFGGLNALDNVSVTVDRGQIVGLIGPNGAGKTTLFNVISGFHRLDSGKIKFKGENIAKLISPNQICMRGIGRTFQVVKPFPHITVFNNVLVGAWLRNSSARNAQRVAREALHFVGLEKYQEHHASSLTLSNRKRLEVARALATTPELLLLDEVMAGLNPTETEELIGIVKKISSEMNITLFVIEHVMRVIMGLSQKIVVLDYGKLIAEGKPEKVAKEESVIKAYLGEEYLHYAAGSQT